jgi:hypothetical protein
MAWEELVVLHAENLLLPVNASITWVCTKSFLSASQTKLSKILNNKHGKRTNEENRGQPWPELSQRP